MGGVKSLIAMHYPSWSIYFNKERKNSTYWYTNISVKSLKLAEEIRDD